MHLLNRDDLLGKCAFKKLYRFHTESSRWITFAFGTSIGRCD
jgi:hypothetical protein